VAVAVGGEVDVCFFNKLEEVVVVV